MQPEVDRDTLSRTVGYQIVRRIGVGGYSNVYLGTNDRGTQRAIKVYAEELTAATDASSTSSPLMRKFRRECFLQESTLMQRINHPNVATCHGYGNDEGVYYILVEYIEGVSLYRYMKGRALSEQEAMEICRQILSGLAASHAAGIVHRDMKVENVQMREGREMQEGWAAVLDFGVAADLNNPDPPHIDGIVMGTPSTMAPEQARGAPATPAMDIFACGCILHEMLTGKIPDYDGDTEEEVAQLLSRRATHKALPVKAPFFVDDKLWAVMRDMLMPNPKDRPSAQELIARLEKLLHPEVEEQTFGSTPPVPTPTPFPTESAQVPGRFRRNWEHLVGMSVALALLLVITSYFRTEASRATTQRPNWDDAGDSMNTSADDTVATTDVPSVTAEPPPAPPPPTEPVRASRHADSRTTHARHVARYPVVILRSVTFPDPCQYNPGDPDYATDAMCIAHRISPQQRHERCSALRREHPNLNGPAFTAFCHGW